MDDLPCGTRSRALPLNSVEISSQVHGIMAKPEWLRIPDAIRLFGIGRSSLYELIGEGKIRSASIKKRGNIRGVRLISVASLEAFLESFASGGNSNTVPQ